MKILSIILILILTSFQKTEKTDLDSFIKLQLASYQVMQADERNNFIQSIEKQRLHSKKKAISLKAKISHKNTYNQIGYTRIQLYQFEFETNQHSKQALDSLLKCFPYDCLQIIKHTDQSVKVTPSIIIFGKHSISIAITACEHVDEKWKTFKKEFAEVFANNDSEIIVTECGKLTWTTKEKLKKGL